MAIRARKASPEVHVAAMYTTLMQAWGRQHWWPAQSRFEVIVGAFLTQNTNWWNVESALRKLRARRLLNIDAVRQVPVKQLEEAIRSSGYFRQKAIRLKNFVRFLDECYGGSLTRMFAQPTERLREQLLTLNGIGPETADSILLYAGQHSVFVVDAYTRRIAERHEILPASAKYEEVRALFESALSKAGPVQQGAAAQRGGACHSPSRMSRAPRTTLAQIYNEMHGLMVGVGKNYCLKSAPRCAMCPLQHLLASGGGRGV